MGMYGRIMNIYIFLVRTFCMAVVFLADIFQNRMVGKGAWRSGFVVFETFFLPSLQFCRRFREKEKVLRNCEFRNFHISHSAFLPYWYVAQPVRARRGGPGQECSKMSAYMYNEATYHRETCLFSRDTSKGWVNQILASNSQNRNYEVMAHLLCSKSFVGTVVLDQVPRAQG